MQIGPEVQFEVEEYTFDGLVSELVEFEREHGITSIEALSQYINGSLNESMEEWIDLYILYLGTHQVRQFVCP